MSTLTMPAGALRVTSVTIDGAPLDLATVLADVTIRHGRTGYYDAASASTAQATLLNVSRALTRSMRLGATVVVNATDGTTSAPRFSGKTTDATLQPDGSLLLVAVARLRTLSGYTIGRGDYPEEPWSARIARIFAEAVLPTAYVLQMGTFDPVLVARVAEPITLADYLNDLAAMLDAAIADLPDGRVLVQPVTARSSAGSYALDPAEVGYAPEWDLNLPLANDVTVTYGDPNAPNRLVALARDDASVALYGPIAKTIETTVKSTEDANAIATQRLARNAFGHWTIPAAPLLWGRRLSIGQQLRLSTLPSSAPADPWGPILEGWTDRIVADDGELVWTMDLSLSDPLLSGLTLAWEGVPTTPAYQWNTINQAVAWKDALTLDSLSP